MSDDPTEHAQEHIHHEAAHGHGPKWIVAAALTAALLAAFAAVSSSLATKHLTQSTLKRIEANDNWNYYQAKSIKSSIIDSREVAFSVLDPAHISPKAADQHKDDLKKKIEYAAKPEDEADRENPKGLAGLQKKADGLQTVSELHLNTHETYETSATMFHIAIAVVAISVVAKRKEFWYMSIIGGVIGLYFFGSALAHAPAEPHEPAAEPAATAHVTATEAPAHASESKPAPTDPATSPTH